MDGAGTGAVAAATGVSNITNNSFAYVLQPSSVYHLVLHGAPTAIPEIARQAPRIYPDPVGNLLFIEAAGNEPLVVAIYDMAGRQLLMKTYASGDLKAGIPMDNWAAGTYLLQAGGAYQLFQKK